MRSRTNRWSGSMLLIVFVAMMSTPGWVAAQEAVMSHGPMLGKVEASSIRVWARTSKPAKLTVKYGVSANNLDQSSAAVTTQYGDDLTGVVILTGLKSNTLYHYTIAVDGRVQQPGGTFRTLPDANAMRDPKYNPRGLYNFSFEFACGNNQNPNASLGPSLPTYNTLLKQVKDQISFAILNGDWLYEEDRDYTPDQWRKQVGIAAGQTPREIEVMPTITGVWENYKTYMSRAKNLAQWHRHVPTYYTFDDHELLNDVFGSGSAGYRNRRAVFRDIGVRGWLDYLGWSNPMAHNQQMHFGRASFKAGSDILTDTSADFTKIDFKQAANLHVHWGTPDAGVKDIEAGDVKGGDPNANVYDIIKVIDQHHLQLGAPAVATGTSSYSIGRRSYGMFRTSNCAFYLLDTRTHRQLHDIKRPAKKGLSMLGTQQRDWLMQSMAENKDADFHFVISSVNFMIPHVGGGGHHFDAATKDDAWTTFLDEREKLIAYFDQLNTPVFVLTGDLHNSFAIKITDTVWEFASGPHNSVNHRPEDEAMRPVTGRFQYGPRPCDIRWSSTALNEITRPNRMFPHYCVVQINNVFNNPLQRGDTRWIAYEHPQVIFKYYSGLTGKLAYAETISTPRTVKAFPTKPATEFAEQLPAPTIGSIERRGPAIDKLIPADARIEVLAEGFDWSEGPVWVPDKTKGGYVLFSDVPRNTVYKWKQGEGLKIYLKPSGYTGTTPRGGALGANGLMLDSDGNLLLCQHGDRRIARMTAPLIRPQISYETVVDRFDGKRFNSPNDLAFHKNGDLYFTDPPYGMPKRFEDPNREINFQGVFRLGKDGKVTLVTQEMTRPNGIAFSPDYKTLYVAQSDPGAALWRAFDMQSDGRVANSRVLLDVTTLSKTRPGLPDGFKVDQQGNIFATGPGGVLVIDPKGKHLGTILTGQRTGNCCFGDDGKTLYITADMYLLRIRLSTKGMGF